MEARLGEHDDARRPAVTRAAVAMREHTDVLEAGLHVPSHCLSCLAENAHRDDTAQLVAHQRRRGEAGLHSRRWGPAAVAFGPASPLVVGGMDRGLDGAVERVVP
jgi:hypothetical protein